MKKRQALQILEYVYERKNIEDVQTYLLVKTDSELFLTPLQHFYFSILGDKTIDKLVARGYLSIEEIKQKYQIDSIKKQNIKIKKRH